MRKRLTNASIRYRGDTMVFSVRVPRMIGEFVDSCIGKDGLKNRAEVLQDFISYAAMCEQEADAKAD